MDLTAVPGATETALGPEIVARLPASAPPAPWELELRALLWAACPEREAAGALPNGLRPGARILSGAGGLIRYTRTPVGPYDEAFAAAALLRGGGLAAHVPFMAVDSTESLVGGRMNWALPKALARFEGEPRAASGMHARGEGWELRATARSFGPALPFCAPFSLVQEWPDGSIRRASGRMRGRARVARVRVEVSGGLQLRGWLRAGSRLGVVVERARGTLGPAF